MRRRGTVSVYSDITELSNASRISPKSPTPWPRCHAQMPGGVQIRSALATALLVSEKLKMAKPRFDCYPSYGTQ